MSGWSYMGYAIGTGLFLGVIGLSAWAYLELKKQYFDKG